MRMKRMKLAQISCEHLLPPQPSRLVIWSLSFVFTLFTNCQLAPSLRCAESFPLCATQPTLPTAALRPSNSSAGTHEKSSTISVMLFPTILTTPVALSLYAARSAAASTRQGGLELTLLVAEQLDGGGWDFVALEALRRGAGGLSELGRMSCKASYPLYLRTSNKSNTSWLVWLRGSVVLEVLNGAANPGPRKRGILLADGICRPQSRPKYQRFDQRKPHDMLIGLKNNTPSLQEQRAHFSALATIDGT